jgi:light-regulated signal transduction histidine kinase (bacteriophytochrome)
VAQTKSTMAESDGKRIADLEAELAAVKTQVQEFTYAVSHDLRAPLRHIVSYAQLVQEDAGPHLTAEVQGFLATMVDSARHMGLLLDGLTSLSRLATVEVNWQPVPLLELVTQVRAQLQRQHPQRAVEWRIGSDLPVVLADQDLLRQALFHVLGNALKFSAPRAMATIEVSAFPGNAEGLAVLEVRDNGVGFNPALQASLFKPFGRLHSQREFDGIGMGLVLAQKIVQRLGGAIEAQALADGGCCVRFQLRARPP